MIYKLPWRTEWTFFGESMGVDSKSMIVDGDDKVIVTIGRGVGSDVWRDEQTAELIVTAVNHYTGA